MASINRLRSSALAGAALSMSLAGVGAQAQENEEKARESTDCIPVNRIEKDLAIDPRTILFYIKGGAIYRNEMDGNCTIPTLGETRLTYLYRTQTARLTQLCDVDMITIDRPEHRRNSCELGRFHPVTAEEAELYASGRATPAASAAPASEATAGGQAEIRIAVAPPSSTRPQCLASVSTGYFQANTQARVEGTIQIEGCAAAATGKYTIAARVRDPSGETKVLEFEEAFQRADNQSMTFKHDYPIGENVELVNVRTRSVRCECAEQPATAQ